MLHHYSLNNHYFAHPTRLTLLLLAALAILLMFPFVVHSQPPDRVSCTSDGGRVFCDADTRGGVRLTRQYQNSGRCIEGQTWGFTERGVWVDRGCAGEFSLAGAQPTPRSRIEPGTVITVRTNERIEAERRVTQVYRANVDQDVYGTNGVVAIPRGSPVELMIREEPDHDLILDLESVIVNGQRYALEAQPERIDADRRDGVGGNRRTAEHVGGGAALGAIIGAIAGGGKGAAIGAGAGAAAGAGLQVITRGHSVHVPPESILTFRLDRPLIVGVPDRGVDRDGVHYHDYYNGPRGN